jgi:predicted ribosome quality control (RQC) complex YloA/Tae2 family protein
MKQLYINDILCIIGTNSKENWEIFDSSDENNIFFHLSSFPSCYVILKTIEIPSYDTLREAAIICKGNTKYKNIPNLKVDYTQCKNIIKGENVGEIIYKSNKKVKQIKV